MAPEMFGPYRLDQPLGKGGMGEVYRAYDTVRQRSVALKRLLPEYVSDDQFRARFFRECHSAAQLTEPHVIPIHDFGEIDGRLYLDMRLVEGRDLGALLAADGPLPPERAVDVVRQVAGALGAAHAHGLVHRDVKPSNVLIDDSGPEPHCYLVDFGVAGQIGSTTTGSLTATGMIAGTLDYIAPERLEGLRGDHRVDVYSLACLLYETLTGEPPFRCDQIVALCYAHLFREPPKASEADPAIPPGLDDIIARGMAKDPAQRPASAGELAAAARAVLGAAAAPVSPGRHRPAVSTVSSLPPPPRRPSVVGMPPVPPPRRPSAVSTPAVPTPAVPPAAVRTPAEPARGPSSPKAPPPPTQGGRRPPPRRRRLPVWLAGLAALVLAAAGGLLAGQWGATEPTTIRVQPAVEIGPAPFDATPVAKDVPSGGAPDAGTAVPTVQATADTVSGDTPGLYGGTNTNACDPGALATFLERHPDRGQAWADAEKIPRSQIRAFIATLTPVLLRTDTAVTNNGFADGAATPFQAVLQAGTAVLVDAYGVPRARCACGNPLTGPGQWSNPRFQGAAWPGLTPDKVTVIVRAQVTVTMFVIVKESGEVETRPAGTDGTQDQPADPALVTQAKEFGTGSAGPSDTTSADAGSSTADTSADTSAVTSADTSADTGTDVTGSETAPTPESTEVSSPGTDEVPSTDASVVSDPATETATGDLPPTDATAVPPSLPSG